MSMLSGSSDEGNEPTFYSALSHAPVRSVGNAPNLGIYRPKGDPQYGNFSYKSPAEGLLQTGDSHSIETEWSDDFKIAWTKMGNKGPLLLFLHGVPTNTPLNLLDSIGLL